MQYYSLMWNTSFLINVAILSLPESTKVECSPKETAVYYMNTKCKSNSKTFKSGWTHTQVANAPVRFKHEISLTHSFVGCLVLSVVCGHALVGLGGLSFHQWVNPLRNPVPNGL